MTIGLTSDFFSKFLKKVKTSGFRSRMASKTGRRVINARRKKGRAKLTV